MSAPQVSLPSVTGVDVELRIAGAGSRSYAFLIDWHIRLIFALAWLIAGTVLLTGGLALLADFTSGPRDAWTFLVLLPALAIYILYHPVLEIAMRGRTPGKRMAGVRIVTRNGDIPGAGALLLRNVFRLIDSTPFVYLVGLCVVIFTEQHVRIGDLAAGTLLIIDSTEGDASFASFGATGENRLSPQAADLAQELLDRWPTLGENARAQIARSLLSRIDPAANAAGLAASSTEALRERLRTLLHPV